MVRFPSICPTRRRYTPPQYATKRYVSISGAGTTRLYGNKGFDATLGVEFVVNGAELLEIKLCWDRCKGQYTAVNLPDQVIANNEVMLEGLGDDYLEWHWAEAPNIETVTPDLYRVSANFIAQLEVNP